MFEIFSKIGAAILGALMVLQASILSLPGISNLAAPASTSGSSWYVSVAGTANAAGTKEDPWSLQAALNHPSKVKPGDTIWIRGGTYKGTFIPRLVGTAAAPIIVRGFPGERATLDGNGSGNPVLYLGPDRDVVPKYTWFWDFEIMNSNTNRGAPTATTFCPPTHCHGIYARNGQGLKFINLVIHDNGLGIGSESAVKDFEYYGNLVYYNGWEGPAADRAHGHGWYGKNKAPDIGKIIDNIIFMNFDNGVQARTGDGNAPVDNFHIEGNIIFENAQFSTKNRDKNFIIGGALNANNAKILNNYTYYPPIVERGENVLGYTKDSALVNSVVTGNYFVGGVLGFHKKPVNTQISNNTIYGNELTYVGGNFFSDFPVNLITDFDRNKPMKGVDVFVRKNQYEQGRGQIAVYNWDLKASVQADLSSVLKSGDKYVIKDVMNFYGNSVASGTYNGGTVSIPMNNLVLNPPIGSTHRPAVHSAPQFGAFVVMLADRSAPVVPPTIPTPPTTPTTPTEPTLPTVPTPPTTPTLPTTPTPVNPFYKYFEAESGSISGLSRVNNFQSSSGEYVTNTIRDTGISKYQFSVPSAGQYVVWTRYFAPGGDYDSVFVKMDSGTEDIYDVAEEKYFSQWKWSRVNGRNGGNPLALNPRTFTLSAGNHTLTIRGREAGTRLDRVLITNDLNFVPSDATNIPTPSPIPTPIPVPIPIPVPTPVPTPSPTPDPTPTPTPSRCGDAGSEAFTGCYYEGVNFDTFKHSQTDLPINFIWLNSKGPVGTAVPKYSVRWQGNFNFEGGQHTFTVRTDDGSRLYIDGELVIDKWFRQSTRTYTYIVNLSSGTHNIRHEYFNNDGAGVVSLEWKKN